MHSIKITSALRVQSLAGFSLLIAEKCVCDAAAAAYRLRLCLLLISIREQFSWTSFLLLLDASGSKWHATRCLQQQLSIYNALVIASDCKKQKLERLVWKCCCLKQGIANAQVVANKFSRGVATLWLIAVFIGKHFDRCYCSCCCMHYMVFFLLLALCHYWRVMSV